MRVSGGMQRWNWPRATARKSDSQLRAGGQPVGCMMKYSRGDLQWEDAARATLQRVGSTALSSCLRRWTHLLLHSSIIVHLPSSIFNRPLLHICTVVCISPVEQSNALPFSGRLVAPQSSRLLKKPANLES